MSTPFTVVSCSERAIAHPAKNLETEQPFSTDLPSSRCLLRLAFGETKALIRLVLKTSSVTHIEVRGCKTAGVGWFDSTVLVPRTELISMLQHKSNAASIMRGAATPTATRYVVTTDAAVKTQGYAEFLVALFCVWEPSNLLSLESFNITSVGAPVAKEATGATGVGSLESSGAGPAMHLPPPPSPAKAAPPKAPVEAASPPPPSRAAKMSASLATPDTGPLQRESTAPPMAAPSAPPVVSHPAPAPAAPATRAPPPPVVPAVAPPAVAASVSPGTRAPPVARAHSDKCLHGCVVVLSGFVNPLRAEIRDKALTLGAKVANDWTPASTHLICVAPSTPKYGQMKMSGRGYPVSKDWVLEAFLHKRRPKEEEYRIGGPLGPGHYFPPPKDEGEELPEKRARI